ncbi:MAG: hypothetical protein AAGF12_12180 [Myxococcota bacterium]
MDCLAIGLLGTGSLLGCGDNRVDRVDGSSTMDSSADIGTDAPVVRDANPPDRADRRGPILPPQCRGPAAEDLTGLLTPYPNLQYGVAEDFAIRTVNFADEGVAEAPALQVFVELENTGTAIECISVPELSFDGRNLPVTPYAPPYYGPLSLTAGCVAPGEQLVLTALLEGVTPDALAASQAPVDIQLNPTTVGIPAAPADAPDVRNPIVLPSTLGFQLSANIHIQGPIRDYAVRVFVRDDRGLLVDELEDLPGDNRLLAPGEIVDLETNSTPCVFDEFVLFGSWVRG